MFELLRELKDEAGIAAAYERDREAMLPLMEAEIEAHLPMCDRDHSCREYVGLLRRVLKADGADLAEQHDRKMKDALAALKKPD